MSQQQVRILYDWSRFKHGRMLMCVVEASPSEKEPGKFDERIVDQEILIKHPFLLSFRMKRALKRIKKRQAKVAKFSENV